MSAAAEPGARTDDRAVIHRPALATRLLRMFVVLVLVLGAGFVVEADSASPGNLRYFSLTAAIFAGTSIALAVVAKLAWGMRAPRPVRAVIVVVLVYHALFGPALFIEQVRASSSADTSFVSRTWPHVVYGIDSLE